MSKTSKICWPDRESGPWRLTFEIAAGDIRSLKIEPVATNSDLPLTGAILRQLRLGMLMHEITSTPPPNLAAADPELAEVVKLYRQAALSRRDPTGAVAEAMGYSRSTASRRVAAARDAGLLPPTSQGRIRT